MRRDCGSLYALRVTERGDRVRVCLAAGLAAAVLVAVINALALDPTNELWAHGEARWGFVHWPLTARWAYFSVLAAWGFILGALAAWRGPGVAVGFARWAVLVGMVLAGAVVAALAVIVFPPEMGSVGTGLGGLLTMTVDLISIVLFMALQAGLLLVGGGLALGTGRLVRGLADVLPPPWGPTGAFGASLLMVLLGGGAFPTSLGAPVAVVVGVAVAGVAASSARRHRPDLAVTAIGLAFAVLFAVRTRPALAWEHDRARRVSLGACYDPARLGAAPRSLTGIPGLVTWVELASTGAGPQHPAYYFLPEAGADPAAVAASLRPSFPPCTVGSAFDPTEVSPDVIPALPTPLAFHYLLVDDADDASRHVAELEPALRHALERRAGGDLRIEGYGAEARFAMPRVPDGLVFQEACSSTDCRSDAMVELGNGHYAAFGSVDVVVLDALKGEPWVARNAVGSLLGELRGVDTERALVLRARYQSQETFIDLLPGSSVEVDTECQALEGALADLPAHATDPETLYWAGREAVECASLSPAPQQQAELRKLGASLLGRVRGTAGLWTSRAMATRATLVPAGTAGPSKVKAALDRVPAADAADPLIQLDLLTGYACRAHDGALENRIAADLRASCASATTWLPRAVLARVESSSACPAAP